MKAIVNYEKIHKLYAHGNNVQKNGWLIIEG